MLWTLPGTGIVAEGLVRKHAPDNKVAWDWGWRVGSVLRNTCCSCKGTRFGSQHQLGGSQLSVTPVPGDSIPIFDFPGHQA